MRTLLVIGIGTGHLDHVTMQAVAALNRVDVVFLLDKGEDTAPLRALRREICARYIQDRSYRFVEVRDPPRDRTAANYVGAVEDWHARRVELLETLIAEELPETGCGAFLVWGDPSLFDSTIRIVDALAARGRIAFTHEVIPGITSTQALTAAHRIPLNRLGTPVLVTTGRQLAAHGMPSDADAIVLLDGQCTFEQIADDVEIFWGAYLGSPDEILISGRLRDVADEIVRTREAARLRHGWIMDTYLLRRRPT
jgi:precorrin-6A synthase